MIIIARNLGIGGEHRDSRTGGELGRRGGSNFSSWLEETLRATSLGADYYFVGGGGELEFYAAGLVGVGCVGQVQR